MTLLFVHGPVSILIDTKASHGSIRASLESLAEILSNLPDDALTAPGGLGLPDDSLAPGPAGEFADDCGGGPIH